MNPAAWDPKISVIMPVFNAEGFVADAIESILRQTHENFEFIIIDDCSSDASCEVIRRYTDRRIRFHRNEKNDGVAETLNLGLKLATGELIARMDADDISLPERFARQVQCFALDPDLVLCCTNVVAISEDGVQASGPRYRRNADVRWELLFYCSITHASVMLRSSKLNDLLYPLTPAEDVGLWRNLLGRGSFCQTAEVLLKHRVYGRSSYWANLAQHEAAALESARKLLRTMVSPHHSDALLVLTRHYWVLSAERCEAKARIPRPTLTEVKKAGWALADAYCRSYAPGKTSRQFFRELELRVFLYCFGKNCRFEKANAPLWALARTMEWLRAFGPVSLLRAFAVLTARYVREWIGRPTGKRAASL